LDDFLNIAATINNQRKSFNERVRKREVNDFREVMSKPEGRRFVMRILQEGRAFHSCFDLNPIQMAKNEGKRDMALFLLEELMNDHQEKYLQMCKETKALKDNLDAELKSIIEGDSNE